MYIDMNYVILVLPAIIFAMIANGRVKSTFKEYSAINSARGITASDACRNLLNVNGISDVSIERISGNLTDHYDPKSKTIRLSDNVYDSTSIAAIGVACHEAGHAIQYDKNYFPISIRTAILPIASISSNLATPLIFISILLTSFTNNSAFFSLAYLGLFGFLMSAIFQLITLPVEFDASKRAIIAIENGGYLTDDEIIGSKKVLNAAAMTYVAALAVSIMTFIRFALMILGRRD